jgi:hypothetical protein
LNPQSFQTPKKLDPKTKSLCELQRISIHGCESAARIFQTHSKRPYFKKIDLLCDRLKQDLSVTNKAVININSHGVAWAIKDFIFVFNRIINAWVIMRDYFYSNSEGMQCVKESIDSNFAQDFLIWQEATSKLAKSLVNSYENLHCRDQRNGNRKTSTKSDSNVSSPAGSGKQNNDPFQRIFDPLIAENTEQLQLSGNYLKSAVYKPLSSSEGSSPPDTPGSNPDHSYESFKILFNEMLPNNAFVERSGNPKPLYKRGTAESTPSSECGNKTQYRMKTSLAEQFDNLDFKDLKDLDGISPLINEEEDNPKQLPMAMLFCYEVLQQFYGDEGAKKIVRLFNDIMLMPEAISFIDRKEGAKFTDIPNYISNDDALSMTQIIGNIQEGKFKTVCDIFIAVKMMAEYAKALLQFNNDNNDNQQMKAIVVGFVRGVESALARHA